MRLEALHVCAYSDSAHPRTLCWCWRDIHRPASWFCHQRHSSASPKLAGSGEIGDRGRWSFDFVVTRTKLQDLNTCFSFLTSFGVALLCSVEVGRSDSGRRCCDATSRVSQRFLAWCIARLAAIAISIESLFGVA
jgi:hypothetical protein